jgi:DNA-binding MarR family transcriptional regulator
MAEKPERVTDLIFRLKSKCLENERKIMKQSHLSVSEFHGIDKLNPGEVVSGKLLSEKMDLSPSRASRIAEKMVKKGFLKRECDPRDRRRCNLELSAQGIEVKRKIEDMRSGCEMKFRKIFSRKEFADFAINIEKTIEIL